jgi:hypothetical protein
MSRSAAASRGPQSREQEAATSTRWAGPGRVRESIRRARATASCRSYLRRHADDSSPRRRWIRENALEADRATLAAHLVVASERRIDPSVVETAGRQNLGDTRVVPPCVPGTGDGVC